MNGNSPIEVGVGVAATPNRLCVEVNSASYPQWDGMERNSSGVSVFRVEDLQCS